MSVSSAAPWPRLIAWRRRLRRHWPLLLLLRPGAIIHNNDLIHMTNQAPDDGTNRTFFIMGGNTWMNIIPSTILPNAPNNIFVALGYICRLGLSQAWFNPNNSLFANGKINHLPGVPLRSGTIGIQPKSPLARRRSGMPFRVRNRSGSAKVICEPEFVMASPVHCHPPSSRLDQEPTFTSAVSGFSMHKTDESINYIGNVA